MPSEVTVHLFFAFDVGDEVQLDLARKLLSADAELLVRRPRTPESIRYRPAPLRLILEPHGLVLPGHESVPPAYSQLTIFDFGAISLRTQYRLTIEDEELTRLAGRLADLSAQAVVAREILKPWIDRFAPAIIDLDFGELFEEYVVFQMHEARSDWVGKWPGWVAGLIRLEDEPLSEPEIVEATRLQLTYAPNDLIVVDWAAAFVSDTEVADTIQTLEFANVQLLEFRNIDDRLDDQLERAFKLVRQAKRPLWGIIPRWLAASRAARKVRELEIEAASLFERADNTLKLIGDQYLARIYSLASARFHLGEWQQSIRRKLDAIGGVYDLLVSSAGGFRAEFMELVIILLILGEIIISLTRH